jgi:hypothetical protein
MALHVPLGGPRCRDGLVVSVSGFYLLYCIEVSTGW